MKSGLLVTGTDTGIGKTVVSALLVSALEQAGHAPGYFKPIQTGDDDDTERVGQLTGLAPPRLASPAYRLALPAAPLTAARQAGRVLDLQTAVSKWQSLPPEGRWVVEGAGGLLVPLTETATLAELIGRLELPLLLVARTRLGTINHTLLSLEAARARNLKVCGVVLVGDPDPSLYDILPRFGRTPIVAEIPQWESVHPARIRAEAPRLFPPSLLERLYGG